MWLDIGQVGCCIRFWEPAHLPLPKANITSHLGQNVGLGEGWVGSSPETYDPLGQWRLIIWSREIAASRGTVGQKFHTFLLLYQDITKPRAPISPSGRGTDRRSSVGMSPVARGPKVKEHLRQPFLTHNIFAAHFVSWPEFWVGGAIAHPHFHRQSLVTEGIRPTGFPTMQSHVSFKSWLLLPCKIKFAFENVWVNCEGRRIYVSLLVLVLVLGATTGKLVENSPLSYYSWRSSL